MADLTGQVTFTPEEIATFPQGPPGTGGETPYVENVLDWGAKNDDSATAGAQIQAAIDSFNKTGTRIGGLVLVPTGDYYIERPIILPHLVRLIGYNSQSGSILRAHSTFPSMALAGALTLPGNNTAFTVPVVAMSPNMPTTGGVITLDTPVGYGSVVYTGISGNSFTGCKIKDVGGQTFSGTTVPDATVVGTFMLWMTDPALGIGGGYGNRVENLMLDCSTSGQAAQAIPGISGLFSNRSQEEAGCLSFKARNYMRFGVHFSQAPQGQYQQDWIIRGMTLSPAGTVTDKCVSLQIDGSATTLRGIDDVGFAAAGLADTPATAIRVSGCTGHFSRILVERHRVCFHLAGAGQQNGNSGLVISALHGYGGGNTNMTDVVKIDANHFGSVTLLGIRKISAPGARLIADAANNITISDQSVGVYSYGEENAGFKRAILTDSPSVIPRFAQNFGVKATPATTPGTLVKKMEVFNEAGVSIGFVPIYSAIT